MILEKIQISYKHFVKDLRVIFKKNNVLKKGYYLVCFVSKSNLTQTRFQWQNFKH